jgi:hypothetical protein
MRTDSATIDLGLDRSDPDRVGSPLGPDWARWRRLARRWVPIVLVTLLAGCLGGAAQPPRSEPPMVELWAMPGMPGQQPHRITADGDHLYAVASSQDGWAVTSYLLSDGSIQWQAQQAWPTDHTSAELHLTNTTPTLLVYQAALIRQGSSSVSGTTTALDPATGQQLWTQPGAPVKTVGHWLLMQHIDIIDETRQFSLSLVNPATGHPDPALGEIGQATWAFSEARSTLAYWDSPAEGDYLFVLGPGGLLSRHHAPPDGAAKTIRTPHTYGGDVQIVDGVVMISDQSPDRPLLAAYDANTLMPRWTIPYASEPVACGPVVCVTVTDDPVDPPAETGVAGIDPTTGDLLWSVRCHQATVDQPCQTQVQLMEPGDRLWVTRSARDGDSTPVSWVVDAATGQAVSDPTRWTLAGQTADERLLLTRSGRSEQPPDLPTSLWWATSPADLSRLELLGTVIADQCRHHGSRFLICWREDVPEIVIWRINL